MRNVRFVLVTCFLITGALVSASSNPQRRPPALDQRNEIRRVEVTNLPPADDRPTVVCAPCDGGAFGAHGVGMLLLKHDNLWFFSLDRNQAVEVNVGPGIGVKTETQTAGEYVARLSLDSNGAKLIWAAK